MPCTKCELFGGLWQETPRGLRRCDCVDGLRLSQPPIAHKPVLTSQQTTILVEMLAVIPFFPSESGARIAIGDELKAICCNFEAAEWLVRRMRQLYRRWPGVIEMRIVYASKNMPWDGIHSLAISEFYPDGIPAERQSAPLSLPGGPQRLLSSPNEEISDPKIERAVKRLSASAHKMPRVRERGSD